MDKVNYAIYCEWLCSHLVVLLKVQSLELASQVSSKLSTVQFADNQSFVLVQYFLCVLWQWVDIVEVYQCAIQFVSGCVQVSFGTSPANKQCVAVHVTLHLQEWDLVRHLVNLSLACQYHLLVVLWVGGDSA